MSQILQEMQFERELLYYLTKICFEGSNNFLIVTQGPVYVQFMAENGCNELIMETISNEYLPSHQQLSQAAYNELNELGFNIPANGGGNLQRVCDVSHPEYFHQLAHFTSSILKNIYGCNFSSEIKFEIQLE